LYGIVRGALQQNHRGDMHLFHSGKNIEELYLHKKLRKLAADYEQFYYYARVEHNKGNELFSAQTMEEMIAETFPMLDNWQVYLCGNPNRVKLLRKQAFLAGASMQQIFSDAFETN